MSDLSYIMFRETPIFKSYLDGNQDSFKIKLAKTPTFLKISVNDSDSNIS